MKTIKLSQASRPLAEYATELTDQVVVLTDRNRPIAAIVPLKRVDRESILLSGHPEFLKIIARSRAEFRRGETMSLQEMRAAFAGRSPNRRLQPPKARRRPGKKPVHLRRLRG